jgi:hypothetical protein
MYRRQSNRGGNAYSASGCDGFSARTGSPQCIRADPQLVGSEAFARTRQGANAECCIDRRGDLIPRETYVS